MRVALVHTASDSEAAAVERALTDAGIDYELRLEPKLDSDGPCLLGLLFSVEEEDAARGRELLAAEGIIR
ncbi:MAG TPA: hypothetical protein VJZ76_08405 [Thermoanaerobaculia bacterium]|nr:hypothetical protein [Thermoanaerobaculia bacterium]